MTKETPKESGLIAALRSKGESYKEDMDMEDEATENESADDEISELLGECKTPEEKSAKIDSMISKLQALKSKK